jgi:hypothetical protein
METQRFTRLTGVFVLPLILVTTVPAVQEPDAGSGGKFGTGTPSAFVSRRAATATQTKKDRAPQGATVKTEEAVLAGLCWLLRHQNEEGSWGTDTLASHCTPGEPCIPAATEVVPTYNEGLTGLALLAFLGQGISVGSRIEIVDAVTGKHHMAGEVVKAGVKWLMDRQRKDGAFSDPDSGTALYNEALATMALCEAYGISRNRELKDPAQRAVDYLVSAQKLDPQGSPWGWRYFSRKHLDDTLAAGEITQVVHAELVQDVDISVTTWGVLALKTAKIVNLSVPSGTMEGALAYSRYTTGKGGLVGYQHPFQAGDSLTGPGDEFTYHVGTMSALGMLVRTFAAHEIKDPFLELAARVIVKDPPALAEDRRSIDYYYWHVATLALSQFDGPDSPRTGAGTYWRPWNKELTKSILSLQTGKNAKGVCNTGGWLEDDRWGGYTGHALYSTAINVLTLEAYYRYENAFRE